MVLFTEVLFTDFTLVLFSENKLLSRFLTDILASNKLILEVSLNKFKSCEEL